MANILRTVPAGLRAYLLWGLLFLLVIVPLSAAITLVFNHEGDASRPHVPELRKLAEQTPLYSGCKRTGDKVVLKQNMASFFTNYQCDAQFADIQAFYSRVLPQQGWTPPKRTDSIAYDLKDDHYSRGDYFIVLDQGDVGSNTFSIVFIWAAP